MKRVNVHQFYLLGQSLQPLAGITEASIYGDCFYELWQARAGIKAMLESGVVSLHTCRAAAYELIEAVTIGVPEDFDEAIKKDQKEPINWMCYYRIAQVLKEFQVVFAAELPLVETYSVSQKGAYSTSDLIDHAEIIFSENIRSVLPADATRDIQQAGRCIAFDVPTAAAFHILRAIEAVILEYLKIKSVGTVKPKQRTWAAYLDSLRELGADETIIEEIDQIREKYRNPIMHPEDVVSLDGALALFGKAQFVIYAMIEGCKNPNPAAKPVLSLGQKAGVTPTAKSQVSTEELPTS